MPSNAVVALSCDASDETTQVLTIAWNKWWDDSTTTTLASSEHSHIPRTSSASSALLIGWILFSCIGTDGTDSDDVDFGPSNKGVDGDKCRIAILGRDPRRRPHDSNGDRNCALYPNRGDRRYRDHYRCDGHDSNFSYRIYTLHRC